jgi:outer membrane lipoprotein-sorting protein
MNLFMTLIALFCHDSDYLDMMDKALYVEYAEIKMEVYKNDKMLNYYQLEFYRKDSKIRMEMTAPATEKGKRILNDETNLWMYMPRTSKTIKLPLKQSFMGSDASNRDLMRIAFQKDYEITDKKAIDESTIQLELKANDLSVSYHKVVILFDTRIKASVRQEMYSLSGKRVKTMEYHYAKQADGSYHIQSNTIKDELQPDSLTKMYYEKVKHTHDKPPVFFTLGSLKQ